MIIGIPKEIKNNENRVGMVPGGVRALVGDGHTVYVQKGAGFGIGISDEEFIKAGAKILDTAAEIFEKSTMIIKVKEPQAVEIAMLKPTHILYTYLHLAPDLEQTKGLMKSGCTAVAYETIQNADGSLPLLVPMSEVAGRMSVQIGASYLQLDRGGKGVLLQGPRPDGGGHEGTDRQRLADPGNAGGDPAHLPQPTLYVHARRRLRRVHPGDGFCFRLPRSRHPAGPGERGPRGDRELRYAQRGIGEDARDPAGGRKGSEGPKLERYL